MLETITPSIVFSILALGAALLPWIVESLTKIIDLWKNFH